MSGEAVRTTMRITKALADVQRVRILMLLERGELCVCQIVEVLSLAPSTTSKHLSILSAAGLVDSRKDGRWAYYRLPEGEAGEAVRPVLRWVGQAVRHDEMVEQDARNLAEVLTFDPEVVARRQRRRGDERAGGDVS